MRALIATLIAALLSACTGLPEGVQPVNNFKLERYLGKWYEIARLDHSFERGLNKVSAEYSLRNDGGVKVINRGFSMAENAWQEAEGKAYFVRTSGEGYLKVSFFGPFYGSYVVFALDTQDYQYAFVAGPDKSYLWFLSRTPVVSDDLKNQFIETSRSLGFNTDELIYVKHD